ncbi:Usp (universal stress protein) family protein, implicated in meiotic chromosome segregation [Sugiyamaella lignohabitans]|uniref:Usp (Universal stress protein) family protein, implicated in meiotic chromosome segregation n=1 Tax=Sugiyamaella lignohabitans TaxID=796027 RepID=A0A167FSX7_9ASCO|nr:Usp (universal stress protein) family protein, implicated in meiotic chromosome segregation [Sugiyamaella lignohabitans]ANB15664.1 Usp (universal stress protein) family protein, implicated in meiotic chromosome segregation [Sugiyamaella lignohabitans]
MSLESALEEDRLEFLRAYNEEWNKKHAKNGTKFDQSAIQSLTLGDKEVEKSGTGPKVTKVSTGSSLSSTGTDSISGTSESSSATPSQPLLAGSSDTATPFRPSHKHSVSLVLNDGDDDIEITGSPRASVDNEQSTRTSASGFTAESLFEPFDDEEDNFDGSTRRTSGDQSRQSGGKSIRAESPQSSKSGSKPTQKDVAMSILDPSRGRSRARSRTDPYDSDDAAIDGLFDITEYKRSIRGSSFTGPIVSNNFRFSSPGEHQRGQPAPVGSLAPDSNGNQGRHRSRSGRRSRSPISRLPMDTDDDYFDESDEESESDSNEEELGFSNEENNYEDIDSSETSDEESHTEPSDLIPADVIKNILDKEERPPGFKEGSALTGPVLSNSKRIRRTSEVDASLAPTNTMSLLAAIEAEQKAENRMGPGSIPSSSTSPNRSRHARGSSPGSVRMKSPNRQRELSPQQAEYAAYKRRIIHPNTAFDAAAVAAGNGGSFPELDIPYTSDHEEVRDAHRAAQLHIEISQIYSNTETRRMYRTMTRGNLQPLDEEDPSSNLAPLKSFIVATDLSPEATHALEWTIGTVLRDGNLLIIVCAFEEDGSGDWQAEESARLNAMDKITAVTVKLLKKTRLQVHVAIEVLHCKSARHALTDITDHVSPTLVILGSRGRSALKGVLLGSFSNYIVERSSVPVMVARRKLQKAKNKGLNVRLANNLRHGTLSTAKID